MCCFWLRRYMGVWRRKNLKSVWEKQSMIIGLRSIYMSGSRFINVLCRFFYFKLKFWPFPHCFLVSILSNSQLLCTASYFFSDLYNNRHGFVDLNGKFYWDTLWPTCRYEEQIVTTWLAVIDKTKKKKTIKTWIFLNYVYDAMGQVWFLYCHCPDVIAMMHVLEVQEFHTCASI